jgi:hypothetical protein
MKFIIELDIEGDEGDAIGVLDELLEAGEIQELVSDHGLDDYGDLEVTHATARPAGRGDK